MGDSSILGTRVMFGDHLPPTRWQRAVTLAKVYNSTVPGVEMVG